MSTYERLVELLAGTCSDHDIERVAAALAEHVVVKDDLELIGYASVETYGSGGPRFVQIQDDPDVSRIGGVPVYRLRDV